MSDPVQRLLDERDIRNVIARYARGVDRRDWELARSTFFEDGTDDHTDFKGPRDAFIAWISDRHAGIPMSSHLLGSSLIEFASDTVAAVETYVLVLLELGAESEDHRKMLMGDGEEGAPQGRIRVDVLGRYIDRFEKRDGEWRIARRRVAVDSTHARANNGSVEGHAGWVLGTRDAGDPVYINRREAGFPD
ncbi:nuclear transport factor 2 family protein [Futiania mangrovi]|uniref:Nuclear transport factor 2 family protein n=1 Tax=Futiania mangrovi TaxID=2959716 RepID=A0A9J6PFU6_9PROT|nr:nuclear transport factor 2 family protein [Futiania mangrovii]MCP1335487.1 nuclear transport factor 2 family protein [Futiania mangrovii]